MLMALSLEIGKPKSLEPLKTWNQGRGVDFKREGNQIDEKRFQEALR